MLGIGQADKRNPFILPVLLEYCERIRTNCQDHHITICEFVMLVTQARQLRAAVGSHKAAQEGQHHGPPAKIGQTSAIAFYIFKFKIRSRFPRGNEFTQFGAILWFSTKYRQTSLRSVFLSMYFAGSGGRNTESIPHSPIGGQLHERI